MSDYKKILSEFEKSFGKGKVIRVGDKPKINHPTTKSGSIFLDSALNGGYPEGRIIEVFGDEGSSKTTLALHAVAEAQKANKTAAFIDMEHALNLEYAETIGVDVDNLLLTQPDYGEEALNILEKSIDIGINFIVVDSIAALTPKSEIEGEVGESKMGVQARMMGQAMRKLVGKASKKGCTVFFINQTREKIGVMFGDPTTTPGGKAVKFACSQRLHIRQSTKLKNKSGEAYGNVVTVNVIKNKIGKPHVKTQYDLIYGQGIDRMSEIINMAEELDVLKKKGAWYSYKGENIGQGLPALKELLNDNPELYEEIEKKSLAEFNKL